MLFLIALIVACVFSWFCAKLLKSHPTPFYVTAVVVSVIMIMIGQVRPDGIPQAVNTYVIGLFNRGALAAALWCVVAYIGALPDNAKALKKQLMPVRGELSIFSALVTISHAVTYGVTYIKRLTSGRPVTEAVFISTCIICLMLMLIMIPLTVISFKNIRKKIKPKTWKAIQRIAYLFYALIYLHVMVIFIPRARVGREGTMMSVIVYSVVFLGYAVLRVHKAIMKAKKPENSSILNIVCTAVFILTVGGLGFSSRPVNKVQTADASTTPATTTTLNVITATSTTVTTSAETSVPTETALQTETPSEIETITATEIETSLSLDETTPETTVVSDNAETQAVTPETAPVVAETAPPAEVVQTEPQTESDLQQNTETPQENDNSQQEDNQQNNEEQQNNDNQQNDDNQQNNDEPQNNDNQQEEPQQQEEAPPSSVIYNDGTYSADKMGFDSMVHITVTIQEDKIIDLTASCNESDMYYFENAYGTVKNAILERQSPDVDIVAESTISSNAIMDGVRDCLNQARK